MRYSKAIDSYISYCFESHEVKTSEDHPYFIFWVKDGKVIVEIENSKYFWLRKDIWEDISRMFELDYTKTPSVIKIWLEKHYNLWELTPEQGYHAIHWGLKQHLNLEELTPYPSNGPMIRQLKQHLNLG